ncbi:MAG: O-antigen ligase family protein [Methylophilaceae bacterium]
MIKNYFLDKQISISGWILIILTGALLFVFSLPHSMALRKLLFLFTFLLSCPMFWRALKEKCKPLSIVVLLALLLQVWMLVIVGFVSEHPAAAFSEWKGQWLPVFMSLVIGIGVSDTIMQSRLRRPRTAITMLIVIPITLFLLVNAMVMLREMLLVGKFLPNQLGITFDKGSTNYLIALLEPLLIADMLGRMVKGVRVIPVPGWAISLMLVLATFSLFATSSRNGLIILLMAFVLGAVMMIFEMRKKYALGKMVTSALATTLLVFIIALVAYKADPRWQTFTETIPIAWDIDHDLRWLHADGTDAPITPSGSTVDISQYNRIAWLHEGLRMLIQHPWGVDISRSTFHQLELKKFGHAEMSHSHNSWIDLGLQVGVLGLLFWGGFLLLLIKFGWQAWKAQQEPLGLALAILVVTFAIRGLLDSIFRDHVPQQFALVAGLLLTALLYNKPAKSAGVPVNSNLNPPPNQY